MSKLAKHAFEIAGYALLAATRLVFLARAPGLHYDEAWAGNFAQRIAYAPGFWPREAMSPYTSAWAHYWAALFFRLLGTSVFTYRASAASLVLVGVALLGAALRGYGESRAAQVLPWLAATAPALLINERFAIELTSFHVLCFGLLAYSISLSARRPWTAALGVTAAATFGITSHILFIGAALAALGAWLLSAPRRIVPILVSVGVSSFFALGFFVHIARAIPEKDKAVALIAVTAGALVIAIIAPLRELFRHARLRLVLRILASIVALPGFLILLFFSEGSWAMLFHTGSLPYPGLIGLSLPAPLLALCFGRRAVRTLPRGMLDFGLLLTLFTFVLAVKPTPRYFELPLLTLTALFALLWARLPSRQRIVIVAVACLGAALPLGINFFSPLLADAPADLNYRWGPFHDNTGDTLNKQRLVATLGNAGCGSTQTRSAESRLGEELRFLSYGDWPVATGPCRWGNTLTVGRFSQESPPRGTYERAGPFWITAARQDSPFFKFSNTPQSEREKLRPAESISKYSNGPIVRLSGITRSAFR